MSNKNQSTEYHFKYGRRPWAIDLTTPLFYKNLQALDSIRMSFKSYFLNGPVTHKTGKGKDFPLTSFQFSSFGSDYQKGAFNDVESMKVYLRQQLVNHKRLYEFSTIPNETLFEGSYLSGIHIKNDLSLPLSTYNDLKLLLSHSGVLPRMYSTRTFDNPVGTGSITSSPVDRMNKNDLEYSSPKGYRRNRTSKSSEFIFYDKTTEIHEKQRDYELDEPSPGEHIFRLEFKLGNSKKIRDKIKGISNIETSDPFYILTQVDLTKCFNNFIKEKTNSLAKREEVSRNGFKTFEDAKEVIIKNQSKIEILTQRLKGAIRGTPQRKSLEKTKAKFIARNKNIWVYALKRFKGIEGSKIIRLFLFKETPQSSVEQVKPNCSFASFSPETLQPGGKAIKLNTWLPVQNLSHQSSSE